MIERGWFQHPQALVESDEIGSGTRVWAFAHVLPGARIGADCNICDHVFVEGGAVVGDRVTVKCGVQIWDGVELEDDVFVGPNATFTNDRFPRSRNWLEVHPRTLVRRGASIGANATILPGLTIGPGAMVGAGALVNHDVPALAIVVGNPARIIGYVDTPVHAPRSAPFPATGELSGGVLGRSRLVELPEFSDLRGRLSVGEVGREIPFEVKRWFAVYRVPSREVRGEHAHRSCELFLVCLAGSCRVVLDDGIQREEVVLDRPTVGLYLAPLTWGIQYRFSADAVLLVFASEPYSAAEYVRDYDEFLALVGAKASSAGAT